MNADLPPVTVLFEDAHVLAVVKPPGISTQAPPIAGPTLETAVRAYLAPDKTSSVFVGTVHRLDRPVSGVVLWAKTTKAARRLSHQFAQRQASKEYWAIVEGTPGSDPGTWEDWLIFDDSSGKKRAQAVRPGTPRSQLARTHFQTRAHAGIPEGCSWIILRPETGRTHQLRVQASARGWPILGDELYGSHRQWPEGIALHARSLTIRHPILDQPMTFVAPLPTPWRNAGFENLGP